MRQQHLTCCFPPGFCPLLLQLLLWGNLNHFKYLSSLHFDDLSNPYLRLDSSPVLQTHLHPATS